MNARTDLPAELIDNPLLDFAGPPCFDRIAPPHVDPAVDHLLAQANAALEAVTATSFPAEWKALASVLDVATEQLGRAWGAVSHLNSVADSLSAAPIQHIGKLLVLWRPLPEKAKTVVEDRKPGPKDVKVLKYSKKGGQRPEVKTLRMLGNERLTPGGKIKRAKKPTQKSVKKSAQQ